MMITLAEEKKVWNNIMKRYNWEAEAFDYSNSLDRNGILALFKSQYGDIDESYLDYFAWEFVSNPAGKALIWVAKHKNKIIGQYIINPMRFKIGNKICLGGVVVKSLVEKKFRNKGIHIYLAHKMFEECRGKGIDFIHGFPNKNAYQGYMRHIDCKDLGRTSLLIFPLEFKALVKQYCKNKMLSYALLFGIVPFYYFGIKIFFGIQMYFKENSIYIKQTDKFDERVNDFWDRAKIAYKNILIRDQDFLNWRYYQNPKRRYTIFIAEDIKRNILAYVILRITNIDGIRIGHIVDILSTADTFGKKACSILINRSLDYFRKNSVIMVGCLMIDNNIHFKLLKRKLFFVCPEKFRPHLFHLLVKSFANDIKEKDIYHLRNWFVTMGDCDVI